MPFTTTGMHPNNHRMYNIITKTMDEHYFNLPFSMPTYTPRSLSNLRSAGVDELVAAAPIAESKLALNAGASVLAVNDLIQRDELLAEVELLRVSFASRLQCCVFWDADVHRQADSVRKDHELKFAIEAKITAQVEVVCNSSSDLLGEITGLQEALTARENDLKAVIFTAEERGKLSFTFWPSLRPANGFFSLAVLFVVFQEHGWVRSKSRRCVRRSEFTSSKRLSRLHSRSNSRKHTLVASPPRFHGSDAACSSVRTTRARLCVRPRKHSHTPMLRRRRLG